MGQKLESIAVTIGLVVSMSCRVVSTFKSTITFRKVRKTALEDVLDKSFADKIDMKKLYPGEH